MTDFTPTMNPADVTSCAEIAAKPFLTTISTGLEVTHLDLEPTNRGLEIPYHVDSARRDDVRVGKNLSL